MAAGDIGSVLDSLEYDTTEGRFSNIIHISGNVFAIAYRGPGFDGWLKTVSIAADGTITGPIASLEFDAVQGNAPDIIHVSGNVYAISYNGPDNDGWLKTVTISPDGATLALTGSSLEFAPHHSLNPWFPRIVHVSGDVFAIVFTGADDDGWLYTIPIANDGTIGAVIDSLEFDPVQGRHPRIIHISENLFAIAYQGPDSDGWLKTVNIANDGTIGGIIASLEFDTTLANTPDIIHVSGNIYAIAYQTVDSQGELKTVSISADGLTLAEVSGLYFDTAMGAYPSITHISANYYAIAYQGIDSDGWLKTLTIAPDGTPALTGDSLEFDPGSCLCPDIIYCFGNIYAISYEGPDFDGWLKTVNIETIVAPTVTTNPATSVEATAATGNGNITDNGGEDCDKRGFVYDTSPHGDPGNTAPADSEYSNYVEETDSFGTGAFTGTLTSLEPKTTYYIRAYAHNSAGYSYGNEVSFTTKSRVKGNPNIDQLIYQHVESMERR